MKYKYIIWLHPQVVGERKEFMNPKTGEKFWLVCQQKDQSQMVVFK